MIGLVLNFLSHQITLDFWFSYPLKGSKKPSQIGPALYVEFEHIIIKTCLFAILLYVICDNSCKELMKSALGCNVKVGSKVALD